MDDTNNPDSYTIGNTVGADTDTTSTVKSAADGAVGSNPTTSVKGGNTGPDTIKVRVGTGALYTEDSVARVTDSPKIVNSSSDTTCQDCLNQIQVGVAGSGASIYARRENNVLLFKSFQVEGALTLRTDNGTLILGGSAAVPALDVVLGSKGNLLDRKNKFLVVNAAGDGIDYVDAPTSGSALGKFTELTDVPALAPNVGKVLTVNNLGNGVVWTTLSQFDGKYSSLTGKPTLFDGTYAALTGKPALFSGSYLDLTNRPVVSSFSGAYADLTGKPTLPSKITDLDVPALTGNAGKVLTVNAGATGLEWAAVSTGSTTWASITSKPSFFDGRFASLTDVPAITGNAGKVLAINSAGTAYVWVAQSTGSTGGTSTGATKLTDLTDLPAVTNNGNRVLALNSTATGFAWVNNGGVTKFTDLSDVPVFTGNQGKYLRLNGQGTALEFGTPAWADILNKPSFATVATTGAYGDLTGKPTISAVGGSGNYSDLLNKPTIPAKFVQLSDAPVITGNAGRVLAINSGETGFEWVNLPTGSTGTGTAGATKFVQLTDAPTSFTGASGKTVRVNSAATALEFVASTLVGHTDFPTTYSAQGGKGLRVNAAANAVEFYTIPAAFSGSYADLTNKPVLFSGAYADLTGKPTLFSGAYADLTGKPTLPTKITDLDVPAYSSANANKVLAQNSTGTGLVWVALPAAGSSGATALTGLTDVAITSPASGQVLTYNGTKWANATPAASSGGGTGGANTIYSFEVNFTADNKWASVTNLPAGWSFVANANNNGGTITMAVAGNVKHTSGWGLSSGKYKGFAFGGTTAYVTYDPTSTISFDIILSSPTNIFTVAGGKALVHVTI